MSRNFKGFYGSIIRKGYNPINQILGIFAGDTTYITSHNDARNKN